MEPSTEGKDVQQEVPDAAQNFVDFLNGVIEVITSADHFVDELVEYSDPPRGKEEETCIYKGQERGHTEYFLARMLDIANQNPLVKQKADTTHKQLKLGKHEGRMFLIWQKVVP